jgi:hypothetical protein
VTDEASKELAQHVLESFGYTVAEIPAVPGSQSADLSATCAAGAKPELIVEAKEKEPSPEVAKLRDAALRAGEIHSFNEALVEQSVLNRVMSGAVAQVRATQARYPNALRCVFTVCTGFSAETRFEQFRHRVAGVARLIIVDSKKHGDCFCFRDSDLFRYRNDLDAIILAKEFSDSLQVSFYPNCYASGYQQLSGSAALRDALQDGFIDIPERDANGDTWSLHDVPGNRANENEMIEAARAKYGFSGRVVTMQMHHAGVEMLVPGG